MEYSEGYSRELRPGTSLQDGKYIIEKAIGAGGFGITYFGRHTKLNQVYAIKEFFIDGRCARDPKRNTVTLHSITKEMYGHFREKFEQEAQTLAKLDHPHIVRVVDVFEENDTTYMVMPFIEGTSLESIVKKNGPLDYGLAVNYLAQIAEAVKYIHARKLLHRDIKPDNIMVTPENQAILIDFGSAREFIQDKTQHQTSILTPGYAPIEQHSSMSRKGTYTDIYSLGAVFYRLLTGRVPMNASTRAIERMPEPRELNPDVSEDANRTIMKAMQMKPEDRHQTVDEFMDDLLGKRRSTVKEDTPPASGGGGGANPPKPPRSVVDVEQSGLSDSRTVVDSDDYDDGSNRKGLIKKIAIGAGVVVGIVLLCMLTFGHGSSDDAAAQGDSANIAAATTDPGPPPTLEYREIIPGYPMVWVEGGEYHRGQSEDPDESTDYTQPNEMISVDGFWIGQYEVTQALWQEIMGSNPSLFNTDPERPVESMTWADAQEFIRRLNKKYNANFMLPSEAEWEYAARGGKYAAHNQAAPIDETAWHKGNSHEKTHPVGKKSPNALNLYDMAGNVGEMCRDFYDPLYYRHAPKANPVNTVKSSSYAVRGGGYKDEEYGILPSTRDNIEDGCFFTFVGLRLITPDK